MSTVNWLYSLCLFYSCDSFRTLIRLLFFFSMFSLNWFRIVFGDAVRQVFPVVIVGLQVINDFGKISKSCANELDFNVGGKWREMRFAYNPRRRTCRSRSNQWNRSETWVYCRSAGQRSASPLADPDASPRRSGGGRETIVRRDFQQWKCYQNQRQMKRSLINNEWIALKHRIVYRG